MLRTGLATLVLLGLGSAAMASDRDRVRLFVTYDSGGYYHANHRYDDCRDSRRWSTRDDWYRYGDYRRRYSPSYGWELWFYGSDGRRWDRRDWNRWDRDHRHWDRGRHRGWDRDHDRRHHH